MKNEWKTIITYNGKEIDISEKKIPMCFAEVEKNIGISARTLSRQRDAGHLPVYPSKDPNKNSTLTRTDWIYAFITGKTQNIGDVMN